MVEGSANGSQADVGVSPKLQGLDSNPQGDFGPRLWQAFRDIVTPLFAVSLPDRGGTLQSLYTDLCHAPSDPEARSRHGTHNDPRAGTDLTRC